MTRTAVVAGASGLAGRCIVTERRKAGGWNIIGLGRRAQTMEGVRWIAVNLAGAADCRRALRSTGSLNENDRTQRIIP